MSASIDKHYIEALRKYYEAAGDTNSKIVDFTSNVPSIFLKGNLSIDEDKQGFVIVDSFGAIKSHVFNHKFLVEGNGRVNFLAGFVLDSHVIDYVHRFVTNLDFRNTPRGVATAKLIKVFAEYSKKGWDCNGGFYYMETIAKSAFEEKALPWTQKCGASLLRLQSMDDDVFLQRGEIIPDPDKIEEHVARHGAVPFEVAAKNIANNVRVEPINNDAIQIRVIYACLLKIGIIQRKKLDPRRKLEMFFDFLHKELGVFMALEAILACLQFRGRGGNPDHPSVLCLPEGR